jgi:hypothetical protein
VSGLKIGYARVSTDAQDLTAHGDALGALGVDPDRVYVDRGCTGTHRERSGLRQAVAACREAACCPFLEYRVETIGVEVIWTTTNPVTGEDRAKVDVILDAFHALSDHAGSISPATSPGSPSAMCTSWNRRTASNCGLGPQTELAFAGVAVLEAAGLGDLPVVDTVDGDLDAERAERARDHEAGAAEAGKQHQRTHTHDRASRVSGRARGLIGLLRQAHGRTPCTLKSS